MFGVILAGGGFVAIEYVCELYLRFRRLTEVKYNNYKTI